LVGERSDHIFITHSGEKTGAKAKANLVLTPFLEIQTKIIICGDGEAKRLTRTSEKG